MINEHVALTTYVPEESGQMFHRPFDLEVITETGIVMKITLTPDEADILHDALSDGLTQLDIAEASLKQDDFDLSNAPPQTDLAEAATFIVNHFSKLTALEQAGVVVDEAADLDVGTPERLRIQGACDYDDGEKP